MVIFWTLTHGLTAVQNTERIRGSVFKARHYLKKKKKSHQNYHATVILYITFTYEQLKIPSCLIFNTDFHHR